MKIKEVLLLFNSIKLVDFSEIDPHASKAYSLIHSVSEDLNLGDVKLASLFPRDPDRLFP